MVVHPDSGRISRVRPYLGTPYRAWSFRVRGYHPVLPLFPESFRYKHTIRYRGPATPRTSTRFRLFPVRSPLLRESHMISFPQVLRCFSSLSIPPGLTFDLLSILIIALVLEKGRIAKCEVRNPKTLRHSLFALRHYSVQRKIKRETRSRDITLVGFPHSEISG